MGLGLRVPSPLGITPKPPNAQSGASRELSLFGEVDALHLSWVVENLRLGKKPGFRVYGLGFRVFGENIEVVLEGYGLRKAS